MISGIKHESIKQPIPLCNNCPPCSHRPIVKFLRSILFSGGVETVTKGGKDFSYSHARTSNPLPPLPVQGRHPNGGRGRPRPTELFSGPERQLSGKIRGGMRWPLRYSLLCLFSRKPEELCIVNLPPLFDIG